MYVHERNAHTLPAEIPAAARNAPSEPEAPERDAHRYDPADECNAS